MTPPAVPPAAPTDLVCEALRHPQRLATLTLAGWDALVRQGRRADLLARIGCTLDARGTLEQVPQAPRAHLRSAMLLAEAQQAEALRELAWIERAVAPTGVRPVLLQGAAYVAAGLLAALGRTCSGVEILVPKDCLPAVEAALMAHGWATTHHSAYDQRYYRQWMHELPPLRHIHRQTVLVVRHSILPETARLKPRSDLLLDHAQPVDGPLHVAVLAPTDMVLHAMAHLFHNDDFSQSLRDLSDLDLLLRHLGRGPDFWADLVARARELDLARPLFYGLRYADLLLATPVPRDTLEAASAAGPGPRMTRLMDALWSRALRPQHATAADAVSPAALLALNLRAHWLRMPPGLLVWHLTAKALRRHEEPATP